jgi:D-arabinose 1-dehydrogenase-like Zn-dependent alcohol dehydrogenase
VGRTEVLGIGLLRRRSGDDGDLRTEGTGQEQFCSREPVMTYNVRGYDGEPTRGGYARQITVTSAPRARASFTAT